MLAESINRRNGKITGIVLIDEIEQHLHPTLQFELLTLLRSHFPKLQIITSTHSPIIALSAEPKGLFALNRTGRYVKLLPNVPELNLYTAQDVLVDKRLFDTMAEHPEVIKALREYNRLTKIHPSKRKSQEKQSLRKFGKILSQSGVHIKTDDSLLIELKKLRQDLGLNINDIH